MIAEVVTKLKELGDGSLVKFDLVSNQANGAISYAVGTLEYRELKFRTLGGANVSVGWQLSRTDVPYLFDDRRGPANSARELGGQPFDYLQSDRVAFTLSGTIAAADPILRVTLESWGDASFAFAMREVNGILQGVGPGVGPNPPLASYMLALHDPEGPLI